MIPHTNSGRGFVGLVRYLMHDKGATTTDRVDHIHTENIVGGTARAALSEMLWTFKRQRELKISAGVKLTGRKLEKPVYHLSLSWHPSENPSHAQMVQAARDALAVQGLQDHQVLMVIHNDTDHRHIHLMVNRVHPLTGVAATLSLDHQKFSRWAERYEKEHGKVWCQQRVQNNLARSFRRSAGGKGKFIKDARSQRGDSAAAHAARAANGAQQGRGNGHKNRDQSHATHTTAMARQAALDSRRNDRELYRAGEIQPTDGTVKAIAQRQAREEAADKAAQKQFWFAKNLAANRLQQRHLSQSATAGKVHYDRKQAAQRRVESTYGESRRALERELATIKARMNGGLAGRIVARLKQLPQRKIEVEKTLADIAKRAAEILEPVHSRCTKEAEVLQERQEREKAELENLFSLGEKNGWSVPSGYEPPERGRPTGASQDNEQSKHAEQNRQAEIDALRKQMEERDREDRDYGHGLER
ncbi:relaxase/mobilization nuclease domain-containing protein [Caballeronia sp. TF1N1]|uniref:relaxase/mobilization nuclease domain-containing protein n=1 Tax=Caballeronia sp. TF1N1 TaxID=2878153 RepID=UPI001FD4433C|nr:relaxase/mobilization nuclease domain-containing protein [Caballeronia sp. TF1N1]